MKVIREYDEDGHWQAEYIPPDKPNYFWTDLLGVIIAIVLWWIGQVT